MNVHLYSHALICQKPPIRGVFCSGGTPPKKGEKKKSFGMIFACNKKNKIILRLPLDKSDDICIMVV